MELSGQPGPLPAVQVQRYAERLEKLGQPQPAMVFLLRTLRDQWLRGPSGATQNYQNFIVELPMSSFAIHAQNRIAAVQKSL